MKRHNFFPQLARVETCKPVNHLKWDDISKVAESNWYKYTLHCNHEVYSKVRIRIPKDKSFMEHFVNCPVGNHQVTSWQAIELMEAVSNEHVSNVSSGSAFILPRRILRSDGHTTRQRTDDDGNVLIEHGIIPSGNPYPYASSDRDY